MNIVALLIINASSLCGLSLLGVHRHVGVTLSDFQFKIVAVASESIAGTPNL
jgi:hypothetical protein